MRLIITTILSAFVIFILVLMARIWGQGQQYPEFAHDFFKGPAPVIVVKTPTLVEMEKAVQAKKDVILWLDTRMSVDQKMFVLPKNLDQQFLQAKMEKQKANPQTPILKGNKLSDYAWEEINEFYKDTPALKEVYRKFPQQRFVINLVDNVTGINDAVTAAIKEENPQHRTLIQSDTVTVMTSTKDIRPDWLYGTGQADIMRLLSFDSMWILPTTQFKGDAFIAPFEIMKRPAFNNAIIEEMKRRHKKILLGPIVAPAQLRTAQELQVDGYITENLQEFLTWLDLSPTP